MSNINLSAVGQQGEQMIIGIDGSNSNIDRNTYLSHLTKKQLRRLNIADIRKDAYNATTPVVGGVETLKTCIMALFGADPDKEANYKDILKQIVGAIIHNTEQQEVELRARKQSEQVLERTSSKTTQKLHHDIYFNESGLGADKVCANPSNIITIQNPAQALDQGPGGGDFQFPKVGDTLTFDSSFMEAFGFYYTSSSSSSLPVWEWNATNNGGNWEYNIKFPNMHPDASGSNKSVDNLTPFSRGNAEKNEALNLGTIDSKILNSYVAFKELGDAMMNAIYIAYCNYIKTHYPTQTTSVICQDEGYIDNVDNCNLTELSANILIDTYTTMLTCDRTVHARNILFNVNSVLTCPKDKLITGLIFQKTKEDEKEFVEKMVKMEVERITSVIDTIVSRWEKEKTFWVKGTTKLRSINIPNKEADGVSALDNAIQVLKRAIHFWCDDFLDRVLIHYMDQDTYTKEELNTALIELKKWCFVTEFIVPRKIIPTGGTSLVSRGCFLTKLNYTENSIAEIDNVNTAMTAYFRNIPRLHSGGGVAARKGGEKYIQSGGEGDDKKLEGATYNEMLIFKECKRIIKGEQVIPVDTDIVYLLYCRTISYLHLTNNVIPKQPLDDEDVDLANPVSYDISKLETIVDALNKAFNLDPGSIVITPSRLKPYTEPTMIRANNELTEHLTTTTHYDTLTEISNAVADEEIPYNPILNFLFAQVPAPVSASIPTVTSGTAAETTPPHSFSRVDPGQTTTQAYNNSQPITYGESGILSLQTDFISSNDNKDDPEISNSLPSTSGNTNPQHFRVIQPGRITRSTSAKRQGSATTGERLPTSPKLGRSQSAPTHGHGGKRKQTRKRNNKKSKKTKKVKKMKKVKQTMKKNKGKKGKKTSRRRR